MKLSHYDYLVVGAGSSSAVFCHEAAKLGKTCLVIDRRDHIAGNIYTEDVQGINVHRYGAHIFHTSLRPVWDYVNRFAEFNNYVNSPVAVYKDELYNLPFNMNTFSKMWGIRTPAEAVEIIERQKAEAADLIGEGEPKNLEEQALSLIGRDVFEKLIKGYTEKQWGRSCTELPPSIIKRLPVRLTYDNNYFNDRWQGIPMGGYTAMVERMFGDVEILLSASRIPASPTAPSTAAPSTNTSTSSWARSSTAACASSPRPSSARTGRATRWSTTPSARCRGRASSSTSTSSRSPRRSA